MNTKRLITLSLFTFMTTLTAQAADTVISQQSRLGISAPSDLSSRISPVTVSAPFSWTGSYFGAQIGYISGKHTLDYASEAKEGKWAWVDRDLSPKPSEFAGGIYAGSNIDLGHNFIIGLDMDMVWSWKKNIQTGAGKQILDKSDTINAVFKEAGISTIKPATLGEPSSNYGDIIESSVTLKEKWTGATRARIGFSYHRLMPYIAGGIAYTQTQYILSLSTKSQKDSTILASGNVFDKTKKMIGYTVGGGFDLAMTNNIIMRTEYRYTDFLKQKFENDDLKIGTKTHNFRLGIAYKF
ncbi:outer membrane protein [Bartonella tribocorum]|uniref:Hemin-binding protein E n=1 Tax=Bartonella tribocorum TaxID=85701 RepID=A0A2M6UWG6_9HYPH|nr:porin [Bartonella tribocorum]PIT70532.1 hemin-binding protein E [Bartonella tribocorum]